MEVNNISYPCPSIDLFMFCMYKKIFAIVFACCILIGGLFLTLSKALQPALIKEYVSHQLTVLLSEPAEIQGSVHWQLFPSPALKLSKIQLGKKDNETAPVEMKIDSLIFNVRLTALLKGDIVFDTVKINGFTAYIHPKTAGLTSTATVIKPVTPPLENHFSLHKLILQKGKIIVRDGEHYWLLKDVNLHAEDINLNKNFFPFQLRAKAASLLHPYGHITTTLKFQGHTQLSPAILQDFNTLHIQGQLLCNYTHFNHLAINKIAAHMVLKSGHLVFDPLTFDLYQGNSIGNLDIDLNKKLLILKQTATALNSAQLSVDLLHKKIINGKLDLTASIQADLNHIEQTRANGYIHIKNGSLFNTDLNNVIAQANQKLSLILSDHFLEISQIPSIFSAAPLLKNKTTFKLITLPFRLQQEKLINDSLLLQTEDLQVNGNAELNLHDAHFQGKLQVIIDNPEKSLGKVQSLLGGSIPLVIKGTLQDPLIGPDFSRINPVLARLLITHTLNHPVVTIKEGIKNLLKN